MEFNGSHGNGLRIVKSFLADRKQRVVLNEKFSNWDTISANVPQGSVLGPLLFLICIDDITDVLNVILSYLLMMRHCLRLFRIKM